MGLLYERAKKMWLQSGLDNPAFFNPEPLISDSVFKKNGS